MSDLILYGSAVKAKKDGIVDGYLVLFGDENTPDRSPMKDFFTPETDFDLEVSARKGIYYHHGLNTKSLPPRLAIGDCKIDETGVWIEAQLDLNDDASYKAFTEAEQGKLGWSSGAVSHLVRREKQANGSHKVLKWPIGEGSLTPEPAEPRTFVNVKSLIDAKSSGMSWENKTELLQRALMQKLKAEAEEGDYVDAYICDLYDATLVYRSYGGEKPGCFEASYTIEGMTATIGASKAVQRLVNYKPLPDGVKSFSIAQFTERDCERYLREAGFAQSVASELSHTYKALRQREAEEPPTPDPNMEAIEARRRERNQRHLALRQFQLQHGIS